MFKWPGAPSVYAPEHELADYGELICWKEEFTSVAALSNLLGRFDENEHSGGVREEEDAPQNVQEAYLEIERRREACGDGYPFEIGERGLTLEAKQNADTSKEQNADTSKEIIYKYLLLATRLDMRGNRVHADIDGTLLFEKLAAEAAREYFGDRAESFVFGTASNAGFRKKVDDLCELMREGGCFVNRNNAPPTARDDNLDVVVWKHFADRLPGKLIAFGQCKTGTNFKDALTRLHPDSFCGKWFQDSLALKPVRMFFAAEALRRSRWYTTAVDAGLLFDRCRIVDFCDNIDQGVFADINAWTEAAAKSTGLPGAGNCLTHAHRHQRARP